MSEELLHWVAGIAVPAGGMLFLFLLKRTFNDFELKIAKLFSHMEKSLSAQHEHEISIRLFDQRLNQIEGTMCKLGCIKRSEGL